MTVSHSVRWLTSGGALLLSSAGVFFTSAAQAVVAGSCTADVDCGDGMVCATQISGCSGGSAGDPGTPDIAPAPCPPDHSECGGAADPIPPPACDPVVTRTCMHRYDVPCNVASDCGVGFECVEQKDCWCSGGAGVPAPDATDPAELPPPDCGCSSTGVSRCQLKMQACNFNSDCPTGLLCKPIPTDTTTPDSDSAGAEDSPSAGGGANAEARDPAPAPSPTPPTELFCVPPDFDYGAGGVDKGETTGGSAGGTTGLPTPTGSGARTGETPPTTPNDSDGGSKTEGGCQVGAGRASSTGVALLAVLGLAGFMRRRARRVA